MIKKLKQLAKVSFLFLLVSLTFWTCQKEETIEHNHERQTHKHSHSNFKRVNINDLLREDNTFNVISKNYIPFNLYNKNSSNKAIDRDLIITSDTINVIEKENYKSYTFLIRTTTQQSNEIKNLILEQKDSTSNAFILTYKFDPQWIKDYVNGIHTVPKGTVSYKFYNSSTNKKENNVTSKSRGKNCSWVSITINSPCGCGDYYRWQCSGCTRADPKWPSSYTSSQYVCENSSGSGTELLSTESSDVFSLGGAPNNTASNSSETSLMMEDTSEMENYSTISNCIQTSNGLSQLTSEQRTALANFVSLGGCSQSDANFIKDIVSAIIKTGNTEEIKNFVKAQIALENLTNPKKIKLEPKKGKLNNREDQEFTHFGTNGTYAVYQLKDGSRVMKSPWPLKINSEGKLIDDSSNQDTGVTYYIKPVGESFWSNYWLKDPISLSAELQKTAFLTGTALAKAVGSYILPIEDIKILVTGTDFDGEQVSRLQTAGFMIVGIIPGGKLLKPLSKGAGRVWKVVIKNGDNVFTRTIRELTEETIQHFDRYAEGASLRLQEALRNAEILDDEIIIDVGQDIADLSAKKGRKHTWPEVKALFKRGQDFNKKGLDEYGYNSVEIVLADGKRLDTYIHGQQIISRKATDIDNIKESTWRNYCNELVTKYKAGKLTNSSKLNNQVNLSGKYYLEIPASNQNASNLERFKQIASEYGTLNQSEGIIITFLTE